MENETAKQEKWYQSITVKMVLLAIMGLMLLIPLVLIMEVIRERAQNADAARLEIGALWASAQTVTGPVLNVPGTKIIGEDGRYVTTTMHILPDDLTVNGVLTPEIRYRGIYETVVYDSDLEISGSFSLSGYEHLNDYTWQWDKAYVSLGVSDNKGISDKAELSTGGKVIGAMPGAGQPDLFEKGISFPMPVDQSKSSEFNGEFSLRLGLKGSGSIAFSPVGRSTTVNLRSDWEAPKFTGNFLPAERNVTDSGFTASWTVTHLNRSFPQVWAGQSYIPSDDAFGVDLIMEADHYTKAERSAKYGLLFIALTFLVLLIIELRSTQRIHIFYYLLVALSLSTLLLTPHGPQRAYRVQPGLPDLSRRNYRTADSILLLAAEKGLDGAAYQRPAYLAVCLYLLPAGNEGLCLPGREHRTVRASCRADDFLCQVQDFQGIKVGWKIP